MAKLAKALSAAAGNAGGTEGYVEDVFSTYLYTGNDGTQTITTGIDVSGEGGLIWQKPRTNDSTNNDHKLFDTARGQNKVIYSNLSAGEDSGRPLSYTSTGFTLDAGSQSYGLNKASVDYTSWTFRKQKGFFDCVKFSTTSSGGTQAISHNLGSIPGYIVIKKTSVAQTWITYHKGVTSPNSNWWRNFAGWEASAQFYDFGDDTGINSAPTATTVTLGTYFTNVTADYVMYVFAEGGSADQIFGDDGDEAIIKTGTLTTNGSGVIAPDVNLGFEPQWLLVKRTDNTGSWNILDTMRGFHAEKVGNNKYLRPDNSNAEGNNASVDGEFITTTGFGSNGNGVTGSANSTYMYVAIRRGPMKEPSAGTEVYKALAYTGNGNNNDKKDAGFPIDVIFNKSRDSNGQEAWVTRSLGAGTATKYLTPSATYDEQAGVYTVLGQTDWQTGNGSVRWMNTNTYTYISWMLKRAPKVMDVVCYAGAGGNDDVTHNLGVTPELIIVKARDKSEAWAVQAASPAYPNVGFLNNTNAFSANGQFSAAPTDTVFKLANSGNTNESGYNYVAYLFATLAGVSKVGSVVHSGSTDVDCGFSGGARFVMVKRSDSTGAWYIWDSTRGIVSGNDPYLVVDTTAAEVTNTDYIDPLASGFTLTSSFTAGTYIFLAIA